MVKLPVVTQKKDIEVKTINGQSVFDLREQLLTILGREAEDLPLKAFFAEPVVNEVKGEISWYSQVSGKVRPWSALDANTRQAALGTIRQIDGRLKAAAERLAVSGGTPGWLRDATRAMLSAPDLDGSLFLVGTIPVLTQWGCTPFGSNPSHYQIIVEDHDTPFQRQVPVAAPLPMPAPPPVEIKVQPDVPVQPASEYVAAAVPPEPMPMARKRPLWFDRFAALLGLLLLLLLILGIYLNYRYTDAGRVAAIGLAQDRVDVLWGDIAQRAQQCGATEPLPPVDQLTPQSVERDLQQRSVAIGGTLNISLAWTTPVDLDLSVVEPGGTRIDYLHPVSATSGKLDLDANRKPADHACLIEPGRTPVENISWENSAQSGVYRVEVRIFSLCDMVAGQAAIPFKLIFTAAGQQPREVTGQVGNSTPVFGYSMTLP